MARSKEFRWRRRVLPLAVFVDRRVACPFGRPFGRFPNESHNCFGVVLLLGGKHVFVIHLLLKSLAVCRVGGVHVLL